MQISKYSAARVRSVRRRQADRDRRRVARARRRADRSTPCSRFPGSKSLTNRELVLAALADGPSTLRAAALVARQRAHDRGAARARHGVRAGARHAAGSATTCASPPPPSSSARPRSTAASPARSCASSRRSRRSRSARPRSTATRARGGARWPASIDGLARPRRRPRRRPPRHPPVHRARHRSRRGRRARDRRVGVEPVRLRPAALGAAVRATASTCATSANACRACRTSR